MNKARKRRNLFMIFDRDLKPARITKSGSMLDVFPTLVNIMGANVKGHGFGRDLISTQISLSEMDRPLDDLLKESKSYLWSLWDYPTIDAGLIVNGDAKLAYLGVRNVKIPTIIYLNSENQITDIRFEFDSPIHLTDEIRKVDYNHKMIWIDSCPNIFSVFGDEAWVTDDKDCMMFGTMGGKVVKIMQLARYFNAGKSKLESILANASPAKASRSSWIKRDRIEMRSTSGPINGPSYIRFIPDDVMIELDRGITIIGTRKDGKISKVWHGKTCDGPGLDARNLSSEIERLDVKLKDYFDAYAVIVHDNVICDDTDIQKFFTDSGLVKGKDIGFRQPYIGIIHKDGTVEERLGPKNGVLLHLIR